MGTTWAPVPERCARTNEVCRGAQTRWWVAGRDDRETEARGCVGAGLGRVLNSGVWIPNLLETQTTIATAARAHSLWTMLCRMCCTNIIGNLDSAVEVTRQRTQHGSKSTTSVSATRQNEQRFLPKWDCTPDSAVLCSYETDHFHFHLTKMDVVTTIIDECDLQIYEYRWGIV